MIYKIAIHLIFMAKAAFIQLVFVEYDIDFDF